MSTIQLDIDSIDFRNAEEVKDFAAIIFTTANKHGLLISKKSLNREEAAIRLIAKEWVCRVEAVIDTLTCGDALTIISAFDLIHRIGYGIPAKASYLDKYKLRAFDAYVRGDKSVDQYSLFKVISEEIRKLNKAYFGRPLDWHCLCIDRWFKNFRTGKSAVPQSDYDTLNQINILLTSDLYAFTPKQEAFKNHLRANYHISKR